MMGDTETHFEELLKLLAECVERLVKAMSEVMSAQHPHNHGQSVNDREVNE